MPIHPKTSAAALGGALGLLVVTVLGSIHGVSLSPAADAAIPAFLSSLGSWLSPSPDATPAPVVPTAAVDAAIAEAEKRVQAQFNQMVANLPQPTPAPAPVVAAAPAPPAAA